VESVLERDGLELLPDSARMHLETCDSCKDFVADLSSIVAAAHQLPAEIEPPARIWISLRNQLEAEGIIKSPVVVPAGIVPSTSWWQSFGNIFRGRALVATAAGVAIAFFAGMQATRHKPPVPVANGTTTTAANTGAKSAVTPTDVPKSESPKPKTEVAKSQIPAPAAVTAPAALDFGEHDLANMRMAGTGVPQNSSTAAVDTSLQDSLKQVDSFIAECEKHLKEYPQDDLAREYLAAAYHQKAELISVMLDRGRSVN